MRETSPVIEIAGLTVEREILILDNVDWRVERGEHWVVMGANGSGKTSLLSAMTGYLPLTDGSISVLGETYGRTDWRDLRKRVGIVSSAIQQMMPAHEHALETVLSGKRAMIGLWGGEDESERARAMDILRMVEAEALCDRPWRYLSQGERQRVLIGRALMARPELLILDEPCAGLDPVAREQFVGFLDRLARTAEAPALVLVTHHVEEIVPCFTHVLVLKRGRVLAAGPRERALTSGVLSDAFDAAVTVARVDDRYRLTVSPKAGKIA